jgi:hypothetical protein
MSDYIDTIDYYAALAAQHKGKCVYRVPATEKEAAPPELSPAARAVLTAVTLTKYDVPPEGLPAFAEEMAPLLAAALRAAAYQVAPARPVLYSCCEHYEQSIRHKLLAIASELESP